MNVFDNKDTREEIFRHIKLMNEREDVVAMVRNTILRRWCAYCSCSDCTKQRYIGL